MGGYTAVLSTITLENSSDRAGDIRVVIRPIESFIAKINELTDCNTRLETELEQ